jgi:hypothetical protein
MKKILGILSCVICLNSYASEKEITPTPLQAGIADTVTTIVALNKGATEMNPLGFVVATLGKCILVFYVNDELEGKLKEEFEKGESSVWTGASVNNLLVLLHANPVTSITAGIIAGIIVWNSN